MNSDQNSHFTYSQSQQVDFLHQDLWTKSHVQDTLFPLPTSSFMFNIISTTLEGVRVDNNAQINYIFQESPRMNPATWQVYQHHDQIPQAETVRFSGLINSNCLTPFLANIENMMVPVEVQNCGGEQVSAVDRLQKNEMNECIDAQNSCPSYFFFGSKQEEGNLMGMKLLQLHQIWELCYPLSLYRYDS